MRNTAPEQKRIMRFLPLVFGIVLVRFPAGLFVYWVTSNIISIFQNLLIYRNVPKPGAEENKPETATVDSSEDDGYRAKDAGTQPSVRPEQGTNENDGPQGESVKRNRAKKR